jgi:hypothetical protein
MKKTLLVAALISAASLVSTTMPSVAADKAAPAITAECFFLPLLPDCITMWKAHMDADMAAMKAPAAPTMPAMPTCTKAAAGAGHLLDCK